MTRTRSQIPGRTGGAGQRVALDLGVPVGEAGLADLVVDGVHDGLHPVAAAAEDVAGGAQPLALGAGRPRRPVRGRARSYSAALRGSAGPGHVGRQGAQRRAVVGGIGHDMDHPARKRQRKLADQDRGRFHLAGAFAFAAQPARPGAQRGRLRSRSRESPACWTPCSTPASRRSKPRRLSWRNVIKQADGRDTPDWIDASHPRVWRPAADGAPVLDQADRPQNWLIGASSRRI